jgi:hypothetical protein
MKELAVIQSRLKAPKGQYNSFGKYNYRSCEDIVEAVKPLLAEQGCALMMSDELVFVGDRYYIKATVTIQNAAGEQAQCTALAREEEEKKGMDASQITGTASSYARKYALNGLFLIDDTKDADTNAYYEQTRNNPPPAQKKTIGDRSTKEQWEEIDKLIEQTNTDRAKMLGYYKVNDITEMNFDTARNCIANLRAKLK